MKALQICKSQLVAHTLLSASRTKRQESGSSSPVFARTRVLLLGVALTLTFPCNFLAVGHAYAATWPVPTSGLSASVSFHETYLAGDKSYVHSGIDIPASAGMQISSPQAGTVRYTGAVPSGDSRIDGGASQKTMNAVSVELQDGRVITLMPFSSIGVSAGDQVGEGQCLGTLASSGDISSTQTHLHMGLKKGRVYYDPMSLFGISASSGAEEETIQEPAAALDMPAPWVDTESLGAEVEAHAQSMLDGVQAEQAFEPQVSPQESIGIIESGVTKWRPKPKGAPGPLQVLGVWLEPLCDACRAQLSDLMSALNGISHGFGIPLPVLAAICGVAAALFVLGVVLLVMKLVAPHVGELWRKRITPLSEHEGGDSMHKLFPASGTAFISRSRMSPREVTK